MQRVGTVRPQRVPGSRSTFGLNGVMIPSRSRGVFSGAGELEGGQPTDWSPWGGYVPVELPHRPFPYRGEGGLNLSSVTSTPGAYFTPPALYNLVGIADGFLQPADQVPAPGRLKTGTPTVGANPRLVNPFPSVAPPTPAYPLPASWTGQL
ncbi:MAG TPA: hypothetical protein VFG23_12340 [Polyangia bacterium]|nr:hypothetical protein [Polyangia bacterium]